MTMAVDEVLTVGGNDVTLKLAKTYSFNPTASKNLPFGSFNLHDSVANAPQYGDDVSFSLEDTSAFKIYGGIVTKVTYDRKLHVYRCLTEGYATMIRRTEYTGRFRDDAGNGNMKDIIIAILQEKFPTITYDDTSIPDIDYDFTSKSYQDKRCGELFDEYMELIGREWFVDENKKFWAIVRTYTDVTTTITEDVDNTGTVIQDTEDGKFGNVIKVFGAAYDTTVKEPFSGDGTAKEFTLSNFPNASTVVEYTDGTQISVTFEGMEDYNDSSEFDAYFKPDVPSIQFNSLTTVGSSNIEVRYAITQKIFEEIPDASSIAKYGFEQVVTISSDKINTQQEATDIAQTYVEAYSEILIVCNVPLLLKDQDRIEDWSVGNRVPFKKNDESLFTNYNIVEATYSRTKQSGRALTLRLNDVASAYASQLSYLLRRIKQREEKERLSGPFIQKTYYWGGDIYLSIENISMTEQDTDDGTFVLQDPWMSPDSRSLLGGSAIMRDDYTTTATHEISYNPQSDFTEIFIDDWFIDSTSTGNLNTSTEEYELDDTEFLLSKPIVKGNGSTFTKATITVTADDTGLTLQLKNANTSLTTVTDSVEYTFTTVGDEIQYKVLNNTGGTINVSVVSVVYT